MRFKPTILFCAMLAAAAPSGAAHAQADPGNTEGSASARVIGPSRVMWLADLRFGAFASPATASTLRVETDGTVVPTGGVATTMNVPQPAGGRGPAQFHIEQSRSRFFTAIYPSTVVITSGSDSMLVDNTTIQLTRTRQRGVNSEWRLDMGGTLNIDADQAQGSYSGDFIITVVYF